MKLSKRALAVGAGLTALMILFLPSNTRNWTLLAGALIALGAIFHVLEEKRFETKRPHLPQSPFALAAAAIGAGGGWLCGATGLSILGAAVVGMVIPAATWFIIATVQDWGVPSGRAL